MNRFLDWDFVDISLAHQTELEPFLLRYPQRLSDYTFASLVSWNEVYRHSWTWIEPETLLLSYRDTLTQQRHLLQPIGIFSESAQNQLLEVLKRSPDPVKLNAVSDEFLSQYPAFCKHFQAYHYRGMDNYVYRTQDLATLAGRRYSKKRNLIAQALDSYQWTIHPLTPNIKSECCRILEDIGVSDLEPVSVGLREERAVLHFLMTHFSQLKQEGLVILVENRPVAFSIYEKVNADFATVHFEKAERQFKGLYQIINRETAKTIMTQGIPLINREEDLDEQGLRQTKLSYFPVEILPYYTLSLL